MSKDTLYLGGPMTGIPQFNFPAFDRAAERLRKHGYTIISPAELDNDETRESALASPDGSPGTGSHNGETWGDFLARDVKLIADKVDGAIFLNDWSKSKGARLEAMVCTLKGKPVYAYQPDAPGLKVEIEPDVIAASITSHIEVSAPNGEVRITDAETGGQKGQKMARFDLIPPEFLRQLALVYGGGSQKYDDNNWRKGYAWNLSVGALQRHLNAWLLGEDNDPEVSELAGEPVSHLAQVAWHCATLLTFLNEGLGTCDIPERQKQALAVAEQVSVLTTALPGGSGA